jgi:peroxiredoxin Q/BCP
MQAFRNLSAFMFLAMIASIGVLQGVSAQTRVQLKAGDPAHPFSLMASDGRTYDLADFRGKQAVVLVWFVKAFSGG